MSSTIGPKTVASLSPAPSTTVAETSGIVQIAKLMASQRSDCVLAVCPETGRLTGIITDKDVAYRVIASGRDPNTTILRDVMTKDPVSVREVTLRNDALGLMVERRFRHLPVIASKEVYRKQSKDATFEGAGLRNSKIYQFAECADEKKAEGEDEGAHETNVVGIIDITNCVFQKLPDFDRRVAKSKVKCPDLTSILLKNGLIPRVGGNATVRDAAMMMKDFGDTGVIVISEKDQTLSGIFTTKDVCNRVVSAGLDPDKTLVVDVMTPKPKSVRPSTTILDALKVLKAGNYQHLPVVFNSKPVGLVDVMTLTMAMLEYMVNQTEELKSSDREDWNKIWGSEVQLSSRSDQSESQRSHEIPELEIPPEITETRKQKLLHRPVSALIKVGVKLYTEDGSILRFDIDPTFTADELLFTIWQKISTDSIADRKNITIQYEREKGGWKSLTTNEHIAEALMVAEKYSERVCLKVSTREVAL